jgi:hypothetical protein
MAQELPGPANYQDIYDIFGQRIVRVEGEDLFRSWNVIYVKNYSFIKDHV